MALEFDKTETMTCILTTLTKREICVVSPPHSLREFLGSPFHLSAVLKSPDNRFWWSIFTSPYSQLNRPSHCSHRQIRCSMSIETTLSGKIPTLSLLPAHHAYHHPHSRLQQFYKSLFAALHMVDLLFSAHKWLERPPANHKSCLKSLWGMCYLLPFLQQLYE